MWWLPNKTLGFSTGFAGRSIGKVTKPRELGLLGSRTQLTKLSWVNYEINKNLGFIARTQDGRAAIFKKYIGININKNSAWTRNLLAKTYE